MTSEAIATRALRGVILVLMVLVPLAALYAFMAGGVAGAGMPMGGGIVSRAVRPDVAPFNIPVPRPGVRTMFKTDCKTAPDGVHTCTTTERELKPGEASPKEGGIRSENFLMPARPPTSVEATVRRTGLPGMPATFAMVVPPPAQGDVLFFAAGAAWPIERLAGAAVLTTLWLILFLAVLFNLERLLSSFEADSLFSTRTVRRLQLVGLCVIGLAFLPQLDIVTMLFNASISLAGLEPAAPLPVSFPSEVNIALLLAGVFTVVIGRIVREAARLAEEVQGTV